MGKPTACIAYTKCMGGVYRKSLQKWKGHKLTSNIILHIIINYNIMYKGAPVFSDTTISVRETIIMCSSNNYYYFSMSPHIIEYSVTRCELTTATIIIILCSDCVNFLRASLNVDNNQTFIISIKYYASI